MADGFGIDWNILANSESPLNGYIRGKQYADQQQQNMLGQQRQARRDQLSEDQFGLDKEKYADERASAQKAAADKERAGQLEVIGRLSGNMRKSLVSGAAPEEAWADIESALPMTGLDPTHADAYKQAFFKNPRRFLDSLDAIREQEKGVVVSAGGAVVSPTTGREMYHAPFKPEYHTVGPDQSLVETGGGAAPAVGPTAAPATSGGPRNLRNNNPGNVEDGAFARSMPGYKGSDGRFAIFDSPEAGANAQVALLGSYGKRGINTVQGIVNRWAPPTDGNDTSAYAKFVASKLGVKPDQPLDMSDQVALSDIAGAMKQFEGGAQTASNAPATAPGTRVVAQGASKPQKGAERPATVEEKAAYGVGPDVPAKITADGGFQVVTGTGAGLKRIPPQVQEGYVSNKSSMAQIDKAIAAIRANPNALGLKNVLGDTAMQRLDPKGVDVRARVADIGSLKRHERSGAAVTISENPVLVPFVPSVNDRADAAIKKLEQLKEQYGNTNTEIEVQYGEDSGYSPIGGMRSAAPAQPAQAPKPQQTRQGQLPTPKPGMVIKGYRFKGGDPASQASWEKV